MNIEYLLARLDGEYQRLEVADNECLIDIDGNSLELGVTSREVLSDIIEQLPASCTRYTTGKYKLLHLADAYGLLAEMEVEGADEHEDELSKILYCIPMDEPGPMEEFGPHLALLLTPDQ